MDQEWEIVQLNCNVLWVHATREEHSVESIVKILFHDVLCYLYADQMHRDNTKYVIKEEREISE